jgi:hypothetical protein
MITDELLRDSAPDPTSMRAHTDRLRAGVLARAVPAHPRSRARRPAALGTAVAAILSLGTIGGVAYAAGSVPDLVTSTVNGFAKQIGVSGDQKPEMGQVADLALPDGTRFAVWRGRTDAMECTAYLDHWDGSSRPLGTGGASCSDELLEANRSSLVWAQGADPKTYYPVLFGDVDAGVAGVRVSGTFRGTGEPVDLVLPVDATSGTFAGTLPGSSVDPWPTVDSKDYNRNSGLTLSFLGADGQVLKTVDDLLY